MANMNNMPEVASAPEKKLRSKKGHERRVNGGIYTLLVIMSIVWLCPFIFLLSQGKPLGMDLAGNAGTTDLLITWLYKMTVTDSNYKLAAVMGILVFVVCAVINLIVYNLIPSVKNEEDFQ